MAVGAVLLVAAVFVVHGAHLSVPPKFIKAAYGVDKALYAKDYGYSLVPIPARILRQSHPPTTLPIVGDHPVISSRQGRVYKYPYKYGRSSSRRRRKRPPTKTRRRPGPYGIPVYATKYKNYIPSRRPPPSFSRYKKKRRPYRGPPRRPPPYREVTAPEFDDYDQEIPVDDYEEYDHRDSGDYSYFDIPSKRLPLEFDKDFLNRHADLYNGGYNSGLPRKRPKDVIGQYTDQVRTRVRYQPDKEEHLVEHPTKSSEESQESLWPGEVSNVHNTWHDSSNVHTEANSWGEDVHTPANSWHEDVHTPSTSWHDYSNSQQQNTYDWHRESQARPPRQDNQWQVYQPQQQQSQQTFQWPPRPTRAQELRSWTTSLRPKTLAAAVNYPSRPVVSREQESQNQRPVYNWDPATNSYRLIENENRPRYQAHYSEADFNYRSDHGAVDRKSTDSQRTNRAFSEPDIGFGQGMEVVDDGVAGWKVKK